MVVSPLKFQAYLSGRTARRRNGASSVCGCACCGDSGRIGFVTLRLREREACRFGSGAEAHLQPKEKNPERAASPGTCRSREHCGQVFFRCLDCHEIELLVEQIEHRGRQEGRQRGTDPDIANSQMEQREQDSDSLLLIPGDDQRKRQIVDAALEGLGQRERNLQRGVGIVALADVEQARKPPISPKFSLLKRNFPHPSVRMRQSLGIDSANSV